MARWRVPFRPSAPRLLAAGLLAGAAGAAAAPALLPPATPEVAVWSASSGLKIMPDTPPPAERTPALRVRAARHEAEAVQLVLTPRADLRGVTLSAGPLTGPGGATLPATAVELLRVARVTITQPTDKTGRPGEWPDPLPPLRGPVDLAAGRNHAFWARVRVPPDAAAGAYTGAIRVAAQDWSADVPLHVEVYRFALPDRLTCRTAFGFAPGTVFRYHGVKSDADKRALLELYWRSFASHHLSPYDPAPLDPFHVRWPEVKPPPPPWSDWDGARVVTNEAASGVGSLALFDDRRDQVVGAGYRPHLRIPPGGLRISFQYRTALSDQEAMFSLNHYDAEDRWMSGRNDDTVLAGRGRWQALDRTITNFPDGARAVGLYLWATRWTEAGERTGLTWYDDVRVRDAATGADLLPRGGFEPGPPPDSGVPDAKLAVAFDFSAWDRAMADAIDRHRFNTFRLRVEGLGGGTFHEQYQAALRGFPDDTREYGAILASYLGGLEAHLKQRGWLDEAYVYWFDEPDPAQYDFVRGGFEKLKRHAPGLRRMLTEQPEPGLYGGPNLWCPVTYAYRDARAEERRRAGESFWWYICCGPKAPYATLFIDHPGTALRAWLWQTFQRNVEGILVWETVYWHSPTAYTNGWQNPWQDPMSWVNGYGIPPGTRKDWGNGDGRFLYPPEAAGGGSPTPLLEPPVESIRWEMLRDGLEDYEYLAMLRRALAARPPADQARWKRLLDVPAELTSSLTKFTADPDVIERRRDEIARALEALAIP